MSDKIKRQQLLQDMMVQPEQETDTLYDVLMRNVSPAAHSIWQGPSAREIFNVCADLARILIGKNAVYGDSALNPLRILSNSDSVEQIKVRMDDKLSRLIRGQAAGEDALLDFVGYWVLLQVAEGRKG